MAQVVDKKVKLELVGLNGNAFSLMGAFSGAARRQGWTKEEIDKVIAVCQSGDYNNLVATLFEHTESEESDDYELDEEESEFGDVDSDIDNEYFEE